MSESYRRQHTHSVHKKDDRNMKPTKAKKKPKLINILDRKAKHIKSIDERKRLKLRLKGELTLGDLFESNTLFLVGEGYVEIGFQDTLDVNAQLFLDNGDAKRRYFGRDGHESFSDEEYEWGGDGQVGERSKFKVLFMSHKEFKDYYDKLKESDFKEEFKGTPLQTRVRIERHRGDFIYLGTLNGKNLFKNLLNHKIIEKINSNGVRIV